MSSQPSDETAGRSWLQSAARQRVRGRSFTSALLGGLLLYAALGELIAPQYLTDNFGISSQLSLLTALVAGLVGFVVLAYGANAMTTARANFYEAQERLARGEVDEALGNVTGPNDFDWFDACK